MSALPSSLGDVDFINTLLTSLSNLIPALPTTQQNGASSLGVLPSKILPNQLSGSAGIPWNDRTAVNTNAYQDPPDTGVIRYYNFELTQQYLAPDGYNLSMMVINGQYPGPTLEANWGDTFHITVKNSLDEGTSLHWHGLRQKKTPWYDGVPAVSMCPIAPGQSFTYIFQADLYGTSWYHSHYSAQYAGGVLGPMVIYGPTDNFPDGLNANNTIDLGPVIVTDWYHTDYRDLVAQDVSNKTAPGSPIVAVNTLIQGKMNTDCGANAGSSCTTNAGLAKFTFTPGKTHRLRFVNTGAQAFSLITLDNHKMTIVANDFVPIVPYTVDYVTLAVGQRVDVLITANQFPGAYWLRVRNPILCAPSNQPFALAAVYYEGQNTNEVPLSLPWLDWLVPTLFHCANAPLTETIPAYQLALPEPDVTETISITVGSNSTGNPKYYMNNSSFFADYNKPLINQINNGDLDFPTSWNVYNFKTANNIRIIFENGINFPHPMHVHGQNMFVVAEGTGTWNGSATRPSNPMRRDTQTLQPNGYLVTQLLSDNPGAWPFHCHIAWHLSQGLYISVVQRPDEIPNPNIAKVVPQTCDAWSQFSATHYVDEIDDGL